MRTPKAMMARLTIGSLIVILNGCGFSSSPSPRSSSSSSAIPSAATSLLAQALGINLPQANPTPIPVASPLTPTTIASPLTPTPSTSLTGAALPQANAQTSLESTTAQQVIALLNQQKPQCVLTENASLTQTAFQNALSSWTSRTQINQSQNLFAVDVGSQIDINRLNASYYTTGSIGLTAPTATAYQPAELATLVVRALLAHQTFSPLHNNLQQYQAAGQYKTIGVGAVLRPQGSQLPGTTGIYSPCVVVIQ